MSRNLKIARVASFLLVAVVLPFNGCGKVNNDDSYAVISGRVLNSVTDPTGVPDVVVWVESDPNSDVAYLGGDTSIKTDQDGRYEADIFLGFIPLRDKPEEDVGGITDPEFPRYVGDARVIMFYQGRQLDLGGGLTIQRGAELEVWDVYLTDFISSSGDSSNVHERRSRAGS